MSALKTCPQCGSEYELDVMFCPRDGSTLRAPAGSSLVGTIVADRYHILRKLGEGGMGQVYLAEHVKMGRKSAIKVMNPGMSTDTDAIGRFNREAANASRISQNNVAAIYDFGETPDGLIYLAMEYVDGEPLTALMEREGVLAPARAADITRQVAEALDAAHDMGIVHRDLKPDNIMLARQRDGADLVKVVDFGIAKAQGGDGQKVTKTGLVVGTPEYMSPEQLAGDALDGRSDTYTLGLVAFHMLTGKLPFPSDTIQESMIMRLTDRPRTLTEMRPDASWPQPVQDAFDRVLQRKAEDRYQRSSQFAAALSAAVRGMQRAGVGVGSGASVGATAALAQPLGGALPPTRVRDGAAGGAAPGAGVAAGTSGSAASPASSARKKSALVPVGAGAGVLVVAAAAWFFLGNHRTAANNTADSTRTASQQVAMNDTQPLSHAASGAPADSTQVPQQEGASPQQAAKTPPGPAASMRRADDSSTSVKQGTSRNAAASAKPPADAGVVHDAGTRHDAGTTHAGPSAAQVGTARQQVDEAYRITNSATFSAADARRARALLTSALGNLPTREDSTRALVYEAEALLSESGLTQDASLHDRGCRILKDLLNYASSRYASEIRTDYSNGQCQ